jgi:hypothetical protein
MHTQRRQCIGTAVLVRVATTLLAVVPVGAGASAHLLDVELRPPDLSSSLSREARGPDLSLPSSWTRVAQSDAPPANSGQGSSGGSEGSRADGETSTGKAREAPKAGSLDFDLLGAPPKAEEVDEKELRLRRTLLTWHQGVGLGMFALQLATTVVGQLNYDDKFGGANTSKYVQTHDILAYATLASFAAAGTLALLAPAPLKRSEGFDRVTLHKWSMLVATAGMVTEGVLGIWTQSREGYLNQQGVANAHLAIGYVTLAAVAIGVGALVF